MLFMYRVSMENFRSIIRSKVHRVRLTTVHKMPFSIFLLIVLPLVLTACSTLSGEGSGTDLMHAQDVEQSDSSAKTVSDEEEATETVASGTVESTAVVNEVSLDGDTLFYLLAAEFAGNVGDTHASLAFYRQASKTLEDSRIAARTAYIALYGKQYDEALAALERWQELEPNAKDLPRMYALTYLKLGQPENAVPHIQQMLDIYSKSSADEAMAVKQLLAKESNTEDAYVVLQKLNQREGKNKHMLVLQSRYAAQLKQYDEALQLLDQVLVIDPALHEVLIIKSRVLLAQGKEDEATALIKQVLEELPDNNALRVQYARMLVEQGDMTLAAEQYAILHEKLPQDADITLSLALLYIETTQLDEAADMLQKLVELDQKVPVANYYLGRIVQNQGDHKQAISYYLRVKTGNYAYDAQLRIAVLLAALGKPDEGLAKLEALAEEQTSWALRVKAFLAQGEILRSEGRYKEGVELYSRALQQKHDDTTLLYARGLMAEKVDLLEMAEADLRKVISQEPDNANALNALGYTLADRTSRFKEAQGYILRAVALVPDDPAILDSLGWVSYRLGEMDEALKWLSKAFSKMQDAEIAAHYGEVLWMTNQKEKAREVWKKGKKQNPEHPVLLETLQRLDP